MDKDESERLDVGIERDEEREGRRERTVADKTQRDLGADVHPRRHDPRARPRQTNKESTQSNSTCSKKSFLSVGVITATAVMVNRLLHGGQRCYRWW